MEEGAGKEAAGGGDEGGVGAAGGFGGDDAPGEDAGEWGVVTASWVGVDVDVVEGFGLIRVLEEEFPERGEGERGGGEEHEGDLSWGGGVWVREACEAEEVVVIFVFGFLWWGFGFWRWCFGGVGGGNGGATGSGTRGVGGGGEEESEMEAEEEYAEEINGNCTEHCIEGRGRGRGRGRGVDLCEVGFVNVVERDWRISAFFNTCAGHWTEDFCKSIRFNISIYTLAKIGDHAETLQVMSAKEGVNGLLV